MEHVSNEEKARELAKTLIDDDRNIEPLVDLLLQAMEWKDEQFAKEKKEIDEQWKRLMAESKSIGVDLLQRKNEQHEREKQQWIEDAAEWWENELTYPTMTQAEINWYQTKITDFKQTMKGE